MVCERRHFSKKYSNAITRHKQKKKYSPMQYQSLINENKRKTEKLLSYPILCLLCHLHQRKHIKTKLMQIKGLLQCSMSSAWLVFALYLN